MSVPSDVDRFSHGEAFRGSSSWGCFLFVLPARPQGGHGCASARPRPESSGSQTPLGAGLEAEVAELNETWNHWDLRTERQRYDIQPVCMLQTAKDDRLGLNRVSHDPAVGGQ